jgi:hypothetical protein
MYILPKLLAFEVSIPSSRKEGTFEVLSPVVMQKKGAGL